MKKRNKYLEMDGLAAKTETHEWFYDKVSTNHAQTENLNGVSLKNITCFVVRDITSGEYDRVILDLTTNTPIFDSKSLEEIGHEIDRMKIYKHFNG